MLPPQVRVFVVLDGRVLAFILDGIDQRAPRRRW
jgi:hypothetical protein